MHVRLTHLDGKLPNLALMKLSHWHKAHGDSVYLARTPTPNLFESPYDRIYGSAIFEWTQPVVERMKLAFPEAVIGGTGVDLTTTVEAVIGEEYEKYDYEIYPEFPHSIGFSQRGCRLRCGFCVVPRKEGKPKALNSIRQLWRGEPHPKNVVLLDNDFFGAPGWDDKIEEIREGSYSVNFSQGINIRMITDESAIAIASIDYRDGQFRNKRIYTAWDNIGQEKVFFRGFNRLVEAGVKPSHVMVYMLIGYAPDEDMGKIMYRFKRLVDAGCLPYPMVYERTRPEAKVLNRFAKWVIRRYYHVVAWDQFRGDMLDYQHGDRRSG